MRLSVLVLSALVPAFRGLSVHGLVTVRDEQVHVTMPTFSLLNGFGRFVRSTI